MIQKSIESLKTALSFDDVLLVPRYSEILVGDVELGSALTGKIRLNIPLLSAPMDTVSESRLAIAIAQAGGLGFIHRNMSKKEQAEEVRKVKKYESGIIHDPITISPKAPISKAVSLMQENKISGIPVVDAKRLIGIVTRRDLRFEQRLDEPVSLAMTSIEKLITGGEKISRAEILELLQKHRIEKLPIVDDDFCLKGLVTVKDIQKSEQNPNATRDGKGQLLVGGAVEGTTDEALCRAEKLLEAHVDIVVVDVAHGHTKMTLNTLRELKRCFPSLQVMAGNVATGEGARALIEEGADAIKVGIGPGSICTTRVVCGVGVPQFTALYEVTRAVSKRVPVISDGGIRFSGDVAKALAIGASAVMIGGLFAGTTEAPGERELYHGRIYKLYRGMGSVPALRRAGGNRYGDLGKNVTLIPQGVEGRVPYRGALSDTIDQITGGVRAAFFYIGGRNVQEAQENASFIRVSEAGIREGHIHDVTVVKDAPNYHLGQ